VVDVAEIDGQTEEVRWNKAPLRGAQSDEADDEAVGSGYNPSLPQTAADHDGGDDG
jgi:hypothetical protein